MDGSRAVGVVLAGALLCGAPVWAQSRPGGEIYVCIDKQGRRITSDRPIPECLDREQRVYDRSGIERRSLGPTLTDQEVSEREQQRRQQALEKARQLEQRRREQVLLARYPDEAAHAKERAAALEQPQAAMRDLHQRIDGLQAERRRIDVELEFYGGDAHRAPAKVQRQIAENAAAVAQQQRAIAAQNQEKQRINERFDTELAELRRLWAQRDKTAVPTAPPPRSAGH